MGYGYNSFHYGKREAEADPALIYSSGYHYPTVYSGLSHGVYNTHYTTPYVYGGGFHYPSVYSGIYNTHYTTPYTYGLHHYGKFHVLGELLVELLEILRILLDLAEEL